MIMKKNLFLLLLVAFMFGSCIGYKQVPYIQNSDELKGGEASQALYDARIMPKDLLTITVNSDDVAAAAPFNLTVQTTATANLTTLTEIARNRLSKSWTTGTTLPWKTVILVSSIR